MEELCTRAGWSREDQPGLGVGAQLSADLRDVMIGSGRRHTGDAGIRAGSSDVGAGEGSPIAKPGDLTLHGHQAGLEISAESGTGVILSLTAPRAWDHPLSRQATGAESDHDDVRWLRDCPMRQPTLHVRMSACF